MILYHFIGFEVLITVVIKASIFCDIMPCSPLNRLHGIYVQRNTRLYIPEDLTLYHFSRQYWLFRDRHAKRSVSMNVKKEFRVLYFSCNI
jgi:hypothetical protein